jgi:hypothetical protein
MPGTSKMKIVTVYKEDGLGVAWSRRVITTPGAEPVTGVEA